MAPTALPPLDKVDPTDAWSPWQPTPTDPFNIKWAAHLYRRAGFGASLAELRQAEKDGLNVTLDRVVNINPEDKTWNEVIRKQGLSVLKSRDELFNLRAWWVYSMLRGPQPLREKLTLFWHNHFATSVNKVRKAQLMYQQNVLLRDHALGKFGSFLLEMSKDPAMLIWLDSNSNVEGKANENYAREVMELFALGVGHYTEKDIREAARAFTGWHTDGEKFDFNANFHDKGEKTVLGQTGAWDGGDIVRILLEQKTCAQFLVGKLYRYFISENQVPPAALLEPLCQQLRKSDYDIAGLVRTMLASRHFFSAHAFRQRIKSPVEHILGAARAVVDFKLENIPEEDRREVVTSLVSRLEAMGQELFAPPNVKGWRGAQAWLNTSTILTRQNFGQAVAMGTLWYGGFRPNQTTFAEVDAPEFDEAVRTPGGKPPAQPSRPEEPPPPRYLDPARVIQEEKLTRPEDIVHALLDAHLPGGVSKTAQAKLVAFIELGKPTGKVLDRRVREAVHAIMCMPEYQLA